MAQNHALPAANLLGQAKSPYLRQHANNPVHWREWGEAALAESRRFNKPILLSIGYAACHWCHVMAHESFENPATADLMNRLFVNIKIDREERPDIDHVYMTALHALGQQGGWPLTMFLTSDARPFWGGTYFPPTPNYGRPSFTQILNTVSESYQNNDAAIAGNSDALMKSLAELNDISPGTDLTPANLQSVALAFLRLEDTDLGGLRGAPKFPNAPIFRFLWQWGMRAKNQNALAMVHRMLRAICHGGIHDHLGGGFARYSTDAEWLAPHFEKMLYDNAQILELLSYAYAQTPNPLYADAANGIYTWLTRDMATNGAFAASEDADSEGEEGTFYVWSSAEIANILGTDFTDFAKAYDVTPEGNWEHKNILRRLTPRGDDASEKTLAASRQKLLLRRATRIRPGRDDKILADWNGLTIAALSRAAAVFNQPAWLGLAESSFAATESLLRGSDKRIAHAWCDGMMTAPGLLDDQAAMARAALALYEHTGKQKYLLRAIDYADGAIAYFAAEDGSFYLSAADLADAPPIRPRTANDNATPNACALLADVFAKIFHFTGNATWRDRAQCLINAFSGAGNRLTGMTGLLAASDNLHDATSCVAIGTPDTDTAKALLNAALTYPDPAKCVMLAKTPNDLDPLHPAYGKTLPKGANFAIYVCRRNSCGLPVTDPDQLTKILAT